MIFYATDIDTPHMDPREGTLECTETECENLASTRDGEGYPWCEVHA